MTNPIWIPNTIAESFPHLGNAIPLRPKCPLDYFPLCAFIEVLQNAQNGGKFADKIKFLSSLFFFWRA